MENINLLVCPIATSILYIIDLSSNHDLFFNWYVPYKDNSLIKYALLHALVGLAFYLLYIFGINVFDKEPSHMMKNMISSKTPLVLIIIIQGVIISWLTRGVSSSKAVPFINGSIDQFIHNTILKTLNKDLLEEQYIGKGEYAKRKIKKYKKKFKTELDLEIFGNKLISYLTHNHLLTEKNIQLTKDIADVKYLHAALSQVLNQFRRQQLLAILYYTNES